VKHHNPGFLKLCEEIRPQIREMDSLDVKNWMDGQVPFCLIDCRENDEWQKGHLPGAVHLNRGILERDIESVLPDHDQTIVVYCGGGYRSALAVFNLGKMGYRNVFSMAGGFREWEERHFPLIKE
jgi:rhodanese-related sulfurtransferase